MDEKGQLTQEAVDGVNKGIPFVDAKIFWQEGYGWTSLYWNSLLEEGWKMERSKEVPDLFLAIDGKGKTILSADSEVDIFRLLVNFMVGGG